MEAAYGMSVSTLVTRNVKDTTTTYSLNNIVNQLFGFVDFFLCIGHDETVQVLFEIARMCCIRTTLSFLDGTLSTNGNLCARVLLHSLECVTTRANE